MKKILLTVIITIAVLAGSFLIYIYSGSYNISQLVPHNAVTLWIIRTTTHHSVNKRLKDIQVPQLNDTSLFVEGFVHYNEMCVGCHGAPGIEQMEIVKGLYPRPPKFYKSKDLPDPDEAFWIIKNGIKMTSMPAFGPTHDDRKIWAITAFLLDKMSAMSPEEYMEWAKKYTKNTVESGM